MNMFKIIEIEWEGQKLILCVTSANPNVDLYIQKLKEFGYTVNARNSDIAPIRTEEEKARAKNIMIMIRHYNS